MTNEKNKIFRKHLKKNPDILYVFGDNDERVGLGGMAKEFRGEPNAIGIRTKKSPSTEDKAYYTDRDYEGNIEKIANDCEDIITESKKYVAVYIPEGIGEGLSKLKEMAPQTYKFLKQEIEDTEKILERRGK